MARLSPRVPDAPTTATDDVLVLHAQTFGVRSISCRQLLSRGVELAQFLGYERRGVKRGSEAALGNRLEACANGGGVPKMKHGGITASMQSIGSSGVVKDEAVSAIAHALRRSGLLTHDEYLHAIKDRASLVVVEIPSYFASPSPDIPMIVNDYKKNGFNFRRAEEMLNKSVLWDASMDRPCDCLGGP